MSRTILLIRPRPVDGLPAHVDPQRDFLFVREHLTQTWPDTLSVTELDEFDLIQRLYAARSAIEILLAAVRPREGVRT